MLKTLKYIVLLGIIIIVVGVCDSRVFSVVAEGKEKIFQKVKEIQLGLSTEVKDQAVVENVPFIQQLPELQRGCEVTSLAMVLQHGGANVDKMTLAQQINRVPFVQDGKHGNPNDGFVGNIFIKSEPGYGVYHAPIFKLAQKYLPSKVTDLTGRDIKDIYKVVGMGAPVWVIVNANFQPLDESAFETWQTSTGNVKITYHEHSVVIIGYDSKFVYVNDPLADGPKSAIPRQAFEQAWEQMGKQAISYLPN
ncbi:C39 family peptidase [Microbacteriaceae bacterium 4G12]